MKRRSYRLRPGEAAMLLAVPRELPGVVGGGVTSGDAVRYAEIDEFNSLQSKPSMVDRLSLDSSVPRPPRGGSCPQCGLGRDECWSSFMAWIEENQRDYFEECRAAGLAGWSADEAVTRIRALEQETVRKPKEIRAFKSDPQIWKYILNLPEGSRRWEQE